MCCEARVEGLGSPRRRGALARRRLGAVVGLDQRGRNRPWRRGLGSTSGDVELAAARMLSPRRTNVVDLLVDLPVPRSAHPASSRRARRRRASRKDRAPAGEERLTKGDDEHAGDRAASSSSTRRRSPHPYCVDERDQWSPEGRPGMRVARRVARAWASIVVGQRSELVAERQRIRAVRCRPPRRISISVRPALPLEACGGQHGDATSARPAAELIWAAQRVGVDLVGELRVRVDVDARSLLARCDCGARRLACAIGRGARREQQRPRPAAGSGPRSGRSAARAGVRGPRRASSPAAPGRPGSASARVERRRPWPRATASAASRRRPARARRR